MDMIFCPLYSGSSGNALFVQYGGTRLLIDAGKSGKMIAEALDMIGVDPKTLDGVLVTHEHSDHIAGVGDLLRRIDEHPHRSFEQKEELNMDVQMGDASQRVGATIIIAAIEIDRSVFVWNTAQVINSLRTT